MTSANVFREKGKIRGIGDVVVMKGKVLDLDAILIGSQLLHFLFFM